MNRSRYSSRSSQSASERHQKPPSRRVGAMDEREEDSRQPERRSSEGDVMYPAASDHFFVPSAQNPSLSYLFTPSDISPTSLPIPQYRSQVNPDPSMLNAGLLDRWIPQGHSMAGQAQSINALHEQQGQNEHFIPHQYLQQQQQQQQQQQGQYGQVPPRYFPGNLHQLQQPASLLGSFDPGSPRPDMGYYPPHRRSHPSPENLFSPGNPSRSTTGITPPTRKRQVQSYKPGQQGPRISPEPKRPKKPLLQLNEAEGVKQAQKRQEQQGEGQPDPGEAQGLLQRADSRTTGLPDNESTGIQARYPNQPWLLRGSCACCHVQYEIRMLPSQLPLAVSYCHCAVCRNLSGSNFIAYSTIPSSQIRWFAGQWDWASSKGTEITAELAEARARFGFGLRNRVRGSGDRGSGSGGSGGTKEGEGGSGGSGGGAAGGSAQALGSMSNFATVRSRQSPAASDCIRLWSSSKRAVRGSCARCGSVLFISYHTTRGGGAPGASRAPTGHCGQGVDVDTEERSTPVLRYPFPNHAGSGIMSGAVEDSATGGRRHSEKGYSTQTQPQPTPGIPTGQTSSTNPPPHHPPHHPPRPDPRLDRLEPRSSRPSPERRATFPTPATVGAVPTTDIALGSLWTTEHGSASGRVIRPTMHVMLRERATWAEVPRDGLLRFDGMPGEGPPMKMMGEMTGVGEEDEGDEEEDDDGGEEEGEEGDGEEGDEEEDEEGEEDDGEEQG